MFTKSLKILMKVLDEYVYLMCVQAYQSLECFPSSVHARFYGTLPFPFPFQVSAVLAFTAAQMRSTNLYISKFFKEASFQKDYPVLRCTLCAPESTRF